MPYQLRDIGRSEVQRGFCRTGCGRPIIHRSRCMRHWLLVTLREENVLPDGHMRKNPRSVPRRQLELLLMFLTGRYNVVRDGVEDPADFDRTLKRAEGLWKDYKIQWRRRGPYSLALVMRQIEYTAKRSRDATN